MRWRERRERVEERRWEVRKMGGRRGVEIMLREVRAKGRGRGEVGIGSRRATS